MHREDLTSRQAKILGFIKAHLVENQAIPTFKQIAAEFNFKSPNSSQCHIKALIKGGFLESRRNMTPSYKISGVVLTLEELY